MCNHGNIIEHKQIANNIEILEFVLVFFFFFYTRYLYHDICIWPRFIALSAKVCAPFVVLASL